MTAAEIQVVNRTNALTRILAWKVPVIVACLVLTAGNVVEAAVGWGAWCVVFSLLVTAVAGHQLGGRCGRFGSCARLLPMFVIGYVIFVAVMLGLLRLAGPTDSGAIQAFAILAPVDFAAAVVGMMLGSRGPR